MWKVPVESGRFFGSWHVPTNTMPARLSRICYLTTLHMYISYPIVRVIIVTETTYDRVE
jgi:hypothetical protein